MDLHRDELPAQAALVPARAGRGPVRVGLVLALTIVALAWIPGTEAATASPRQDRMQQELRLALDPFSAAHHLYLEGLQAYEEEEYDKAYAILKPLAQQGHTQAQFHLGTMYFHGRGIGRDSMAALVWYLAAADQGHTQAQYNVGVAYAQGIGVDRDMRRATVWWRKAALKGSTDAQFNLGLVYGKGYGVARDAVAAARWWRMAALQGDPAAQFNLGMMYARGDGVDRNWEQALDWWRKAARQGFSHAIKALKSARRDEYASAR